MYFKKQKLVKQKLKIEKLRLEINDWKLSINFKKSNSQFNQSKIRHYKIAIRNLKFKIHNSESKIMNYFDDVFTSNFESYCVRPFSLHFGFPGIAKCLSDFSSLCVLLIFLTNVGHPLLLRCFLFYSFSFNCKSSIFDFRSQIRSHALFSVFFQL